MRVLDVIFERHNEGSIAVSKRKQALILVGIYTVLFLVAFLIAYSPFLISHKSFVWQSDGRTQHYPIFVFLGRTIRKTILNFLHGDFSVPLFDLSVSLGDDLIAFFNINGDTNPLMLLSGIVLTKYSEFAFGFLAIFRVYLAGLSFLFFCKYYGKKRIYALIGSITYTFSGYGLLCSMRHPFFIEGMYLLPILIVGADKIIKREKPYTLIITVFYSLLCGFYEFYMMTIMLLVFSAIRFFDIYKEKRCKEFFLAVCRGIGAYAVGVCMAGVVFLPSVVEFLNGYRSGHSNFFPYNYTLEFILARLMKLLAPSGNMGWAWPTMAAICILAVVVLFFSKKKRTLKLLTLTALVVFCSDVGNFIMNGFQYPSERWDFGLAFVLSFAVVEMLPQLINATVKEKIICVLFTAGVGFGAFFTKQGRTMNYSEVGVCLLTFTLLVVLAEMHQVGNSIIIQRTGLSTENIRCVILLLMVIVNVGVNGIYWAAADQGKYSTQFKEFGYEVERLETAPERELEPYLLNNPEGRGDGIQFTRNTSEVWSIPALTTYSAAANKVITTYYTQTESIGQTSPFTILSTDQRSGLLALSSVKYYVAPEDYKGCVPFGYDAIKTTKNGNTVYENQYALPWGYTYDAAVTYEELEKHNGLQMEEIMLQAVALDGLPNGYENGTVESNSISIPYTTECKNCKWENNQLAASQANAVVTLNCSIPASTEGYLRIKGLDTSSINASTITIRVNDGNASKTATVLSPKSSWYAGKENFIVNLGYCTKERTSLTVTFSHKGVYKIDDIELYALPMDNYPERVEALRAEPLENIQWGTNSLTGTVDLSKDKILCVSVPYSKGWTATVDGEKVEILRGNYMFMCLPLSAGHHDIGFHYCSPGIKLGAVLTICSAGIVIWMLVRDKKKKAGKTDGV